MNKGALIIISGPSGSGKDTVLTELFKVLPELKFSISSVSREMRSNEKQGEKYNFISREKFQQMIKEDKLLEYNLYLGNYYGTPREPIDNAIADNKEIVIEVDVNGAENIKKKCSDCYSIFIMPPSLDELKNRLERRGTESPEVIAKRIERAKDEIKRADSYDYIVVNDILQNAVENIVKIIKSERLKPHRN